MDYELANPPTRLNQYFKDVGALLSVDETCRANDIFEKARAGWEEIITKKDVAILQQDISKAALSGDREGVEQAITRFTINEAARGKAFQSKVARDLLIELRSADTEVSRKNFEIIAKRFNAQAKRLHKCATAIDILQPAEGIVSLGIEEREAWVDAQLAAQELTRLLPVLVTAAELAGVKASKETTFGLCCNAEGVHRRRAWEAWESKGRCDRWGFLVALGCKIHPVNLDDLEAYSQPRPVKTKLIRTATGICQIQVDPEDEDYVQQTDLTKTLTDKEAKVAKAWSDVLSKTNEVKAEKG